MQAKLKEPTVIEVTDVTTGATDDMELSDQVTRFAIGFGKLLVATVTQCKVFNTGRSFGVAASVATVDISDLLLGICLAPRAFCLLLAETGPQVISLTVCLVCSVCFAYRSMCGDDASSSKYNGVQEEVQVFDYQGKHLCAPKHPKIGLHALSMPLVSVSNDFVAIVEPVKRTAVYFFSTLGGQVTAEPLMIRKEDDTRRLVSDGNVAIMDIVSIALSQAGGEVCRQSMNAICLPAGHVCMRQAFTR